MLAHDLAGSGEPTVVLLHAIGSRRDWDPVFDTLATTHRVIRFDLPGFGDSPPGAATPPEMAAEAAAALDALGVERPVCVGLSIGGWVALELARMGRAQRVVALGPAGLWRRRSPLPTDARLLAGRWFSLIYRPLLPPAMRVRLFRRFWLRDISARPGDVPAEQAAQLWRDTARARGFLRFFRRTRRLRFTGGADIDCPVVVAFGEHDKIAPAKRSRTTEELPSQAEVQTWPGCGHNLIWDAPERVVSSILA
jgi:pimeloyl-ACP methyl ester carboxylesterase